MMTPEQFAEHERIVQGNLAAATALLSEIESHPWRLIRNARLRREVAGILDRNQRQLGRFWTA